MRRMSSTIIAAAILLLVAPAGLAASEGAGVELPALGVIVNPSRNNIVVRTAPPRVSAFSYELADRICSVGVGTVFEAMKEVRIINGEIWYRVHIERVNVRNPSPDWEGGEIDGWISGKLKKYWVVSFLPEDIKRYAKVSPSVHGERQNMLPGGRDFREGTPANVISPSTGDRTSRYTGNDRSSRLAVPGDMELTREHPPENEVAQGRVDTLYLFPAGESGEQETSGPEDTTVSDSALAAATGPIYGTGEYVDPEQGGFSFLARYLFLLLGSCFAVIVLAIERSESLNVKKWLTPIVPFEFLVLGVANVVFVVLLLSAFVKRSETSIVAECFSVFAGPDFGFFFLGFIVSVLLMKFIAFARK